VAVETRGELTVGRTVMDLRSRGSLPPNCNVAFHADAALFNRTLLETFRRTVAKVG
jgi:purine nucleosidase/ribosylpyrimidine nucleosidase